MAWERERERFMRQDTSGVLAFRVTVMLSCLILVPGAAIFGSAFPELVQRQLVDRLRALAELIPHEATSPSPIVDPRVAQAAHTAPNAAPTWPAAEAAPAWEPPVSAQQPYPVTAHQVEYSEEQPAVANAPQQPPVGGNGDYFTDIQHRLREYGASYYALEAVGQHGELYRFACTMTDPAGNARDFSATDRDPLQAMHHVIGDVEAWRQQTARPVYRR